MHTTETEAFLAHYGVKGMKWGVTRKSGGSKSSSEEGGSKPKRKIDKKKVATAAAIVGGAAALTVAVVVLKKHQISLGEASVTSQMKKMGGESTWDVLTKVSTTPKAAAPPTRADLDARVDALKKKVGEDAVRQQIKDFSKQSMWDIMTDTPKPTQSAPAQAQAAPKKTGLKSPAQKRREGEEAAKEQIKAFASKSMWDIAADTSLTPSKKSSYSDRAKKSDTKLYGAKGASQIKKQVDRGIPLSEARQKAAVKTYGPTAARVAANVGTAKAKETAKTKIDRAKKRR